MPYPETGTTSGPQAGTASTTSATGRAPDGATRRRLRSSTVILGGMGVLAAALSACSSEPDKRCVDRNSYDYTGGYKVVDSSKCRGGSSGSSGGSGGGSYSGSKSKGKGGRFGGGSDPQWYYDSDKSGRYADSGTFSKSQAVDRGGFGCSGRGSSGG